jgi:hypothetical protein
MNGARAQEAAGAKRADDPAAVEARRHYEEGTKAFNLGEFPRAIAEFKAAYNAKDDPSLLYNIGQAFRLQGDAAQAIFFYRSYLRNMPNSPNRREVEGRIRTLEKQLEDQKKADQKMEATTPVVVPPAAAVTAPPAAGASAAETVPAPEATAPPAAAAPPSSKQDTAPASTVTPLPTAVPSVPSTPGADLTRQPADQPAASTPFYKTWWFWTAVGVVAVVGVGAGIAAARDKPPSTSLGLYDPTFVKP